MHLLSENHPGSELYESLEDAYAIHQEFAEWLDPNKKDHDVISLEYIGDEDGRNILRFSNGKFLIELNTLPIMVSILKHPLFTTNFLKYDQNYSRYARSSFSGNSCSCRSKMKNTSSVAHAQWGVCYFENAPIMFKNLKQFLTSNKHEELADIDYSIVADEFNSLVRSLDKVGS